MMLETKRLVLRRWQEEDALAVYEYAKDPLVGPSAGWKPHQNVEESKEIIKTIFMRDDTFAITVKESGAIIGCIGIMQGKRSNIGIPEEEVEFGYWLGVPHWGKGYATEASKRIIAYAFDTLHVTKVWSGFFIGNERSKNVIEKCGLHYDHMVEERYWPTLDKHISEANYCITKAEWEAKKEHND